VAWSDERLVGSEGELPQVGNTVDAKTATWTNNIGASELIAVWEDPDFDPENPAVYCARTRDSYATRDNL